LPPIRRSRRRRQPDLWRQDPQLGEAEAHYQAVVKLAVNVADAHYDYGVLLGLQERWDEAAGAYREALVLNPLHAQAHNNLGQIHERQRNLEEAAAEYGRAVESQPTLRIARFNRGRMLIALGRPDEAVRELQVLTEPRDADAAIPVRAGHGAHTRGPARGRPQMGDRRARPRPETRRHRARGGDRQGPGEDQMRMALATACVGASVAWTLAFQKPLFVESAAATGLTFTHVNGAAGEYYMAEVMGAGAALFDYDNDGDLDVFLVQGGPLDGRRRAGGPTSRLFRNDLSASGGARTLQFTDVTERAGVGLRAYGMGTAVADYDNDGDLDLLVTTFGPETLYRNNGNGTFTDVTAQAGVSDPLWSTSAAFADYDRDGDLDLFVANYLDFTVAGNKVCHDAVGARDYCSPRAYRPVPDKLYRNEGGGRFTDVTESAGISKADGAGLGVATGDYNADGWVDFYVANDANPNQLWINRRDGTFADEGLLSGAAVNASGNGGEHGRRVGDYDQDGDEDSSSRTSPADVRAPNDGKGNFDARAGGSRRPRRPSPASAPTGSTTTTTACSTCSSPTAQ
jgi:hypothetical protein